MEPRQDRAGGPYLLGVRDVEELATDHTLERQRDALDLDLSPPVGGTHRHGHR